MKYPEGADLTRTALVRGQWWWIVGYGPAEDTWCCERYDGITTLAWIFHEDELESVI